MTSVRFRRCPPGGLPVLISALVLVSCATTVVPPSQPEFAQPAPVTYEQKLSWILQLEDQRILRDPSVVDSELPTIASLPVIDAQDAVANSAVSDVTVTPPAPPAVADLQRLATDLSAAVRRRAVIAIGRVGLVDGVETLVGALDDPQMEVREMAAFGLGLIGDVSGVAPLIAALEDESPVVQARAAQSLGRLGATNATEAIQAMVARHVTDAYEVDPEDLSYPQPPRVEAFRSGLYALASLDAYDALAATVLTEDGAPILWWWPVAHALGQVGDLRALGPLSALTGIQGSVGVAIAARGLGTLGDTAGLPALVKLLDPSRRDRRVIISAVRALAELGDATAAPALQRLLRMPDLDLPLLRELVEALVAVRAPDSAQLMIELLTHPSPVLRGAALGGLARLDSELFLRTLSGLPPDPQWQVRADLAASFVYVDPDVAAFRLTMLLEDEDRRVVPAVLRALVQSRAPNAPRVLLAHLSDTDVVVRKTAATLLGELELSQAVEPLATAYRASVADSSYVARAAAIDALARIGGSVAIDTITAALEDEDWAVRVRAAEHLTALGESSDAVSAIRPALSRFPLEVYRSPELITPSVSPHVFIETDRGTIQLELYVNEAPLTGDNFVRLARSGFYNGLLAHRVVPNYVVQAGDPRSDSEGGPGYTIRDELSPLPYLRGTVGMALDWRDTGGSQFFITTTPQPQLDARYPVFAHVIAGMEVVDQLEPGDIIRRVRVWDGTTPPQ